MLRDALCPCHASNWTEGARTLFYQGKARNDESPWSLFNHPDGESLDVFEFIARVLCLNLSRHAPPRMNSAS